MPKKPSARTEPQADARRREIVTAATTLFDEHGYSNTSMQDIAVLVGIAKPTLYHYFQSKSEILNRIHEEFMDKLLSGHEERLALSLSPDQLLLEVMADILGLMETHRGHVRVFFEHHRELSSEHRTISFEKRDRYQKHVEDIFASGVRSGTFRDIDPRTAAFATFGICNWAYQWYRPGGAHRPRTLAYMFSDYLINGVGSQRSRIEDLAIADTV